MISVFIKTYGCQANVADSEHLKSYLRDLGCSLVDQEEAADLIIINTCAIRQKAEQKAFSYIGRLVDYKEKKPYMMVGVIGCIASYRKQEIIERYSYISFVFGARDDRDYLKAYIADVIELLATQKQLFGVNSEEYKPVKQRVKDVVGFVKRRGLLVRGSFVSFDTPPVGATPAFAEALAGMQDERKKEFVLRRPFASSVDRAEPLDKFKRSMINIMRGCDNYCSYCIVPFTTGRERSFVMSSILDQVKRDVEAGATEIMLIGQNVDSYKDPETGARFATLLEKTAQIEGDFWVRFVSPHPKDMTTDVIDVIAAYNNKLCAYIHFPLQSGSSKILESMNRTYTVEKYMEQIEQIKKRLPHVTITTDIIVGFPGETEDDYSATRSVVEKVSYTAIYSFVYSPRKYTKAAQMPDDCSYSVKQKRLEDLQARQRQIGTAVNKKLIGTVQRVLVEEQTSKGYCWGRNEGNMKVRIMNKQYVPNQFVMVKIENAGLTHLEGMALLEDDLKEMCNGELSASL